MDDGMSAIQIHDQQMQFLGEIKGVIEVCRDELGYSKEQVKNVIIRRFKLSPKEADDYIDLYY